MPKNKEIIIRVSGVAGCGKSAVMAIIAKALQDAGFTSVTQQHLDQEPYSVVRALDIATSVRDCKLSIQEHYIGRELLVLDDPPRDPEEVRSQMGAVRAWARK